MRNSKDEELEAKAMAFYDAMNALLKEYDVISDEEPYFRVQSKNFAFVAPRNGPCGDLCPKVVEVVENGIKKVKITCVPC